MSSICRGSRPKQVVRHILDRTADSAGLPFDDRLAPARVAVVGGNLQEEPSEAGAVKSSSALIFIKPSPFTKCLDIRYCNYNSMLRYHETSGERQSGR